MIVNALLKLLFASKLLPQDIQETTDSVKTSTNPQQSEPWIVLANQYYLRNISWDGETKLLSSDFRDATLLDFFWEEKRLFVGDSAQRKLFTMDFEQQTEPQLLNGTRIIGQDAEQIAVDWLNRKLYLITKASRSVVVCGLEGELCATVLQNEFREPRGLVLHPRKGYLFYSDISPTPHIARVGLDGSNYTLLVTRDLLWPGALTLDFTQERIYWGDAYFNEIWSVDLNGEGRKQVSVSAQALSHIFDLEVFGDWLIWSDWNLKEVIRAKKENGSDVQSMYRVIQLPNALKVVHPSKQPSFSLWVHPCSDRNGGCSHHCLLKPGGEEFSCVCPDTMRLGPDGKTCEVDCADSQFLFQCRADKVCIGRNLLCDGVPDCPDASDEDSCERRYCEMEQFQCDGQCIPANLVCDGQIQCADGTDELGCGTKQCGRDEFRCTTGACVPLSRTCDRNPDCSDAADESPALCLNTTRECRHYEFRCGNGRCVGMEAVCNGFLDCEDQSDEPLASCLSLVQSEGCPRGWTRCSNASYQCIRSADMCEGKVQCARREDEAATTCAAYNCGPGMFKCASGNKCIPVRWLCDADNDCEDGSDESETMCRDGTRPCSEVEFRCPVSGKCIHQFLVCNGRAHCPHGEDEDNTFCKSQWTCPPGLSMCGTGHCIESSKWCDKRRDCVDLSDETNCTDIPRRACADKYELECGNEICVPRTYVCDGDNDCGDWTDERGPYCTADQCQSQVSVSSGFWCQTAGKCVSSLGLCNGVDDCGDNSDEAPQLCAQAAGPQPFAGFPGAPFGGNQGK